jgi:hypothetical protein
MGMAVESFSDGVLTVKVSGQLSAQEWRDGQAAAVERMRTAPSGDVGVLVRSDSFAGWERGRWDAGSTQAEFNQRVHRLAVVGDPKWEDLVLMFAGKGVRRMEIEYFAPADESKAMAWLKRKA